VIWVLLAAAPAYAQDAWPPPEVTVQPHQPHGPIAVPPPAPEALESAPPTAPGGWSLTEITGALVAIVTALGTAFGGGGLAYHVTCRKGELQLGRGSLDWDALTTRLEARIDARFDQLESRLEGLQPKIPTRPAGPPSVQPPPAAPPRRDPPQIQLAEQPPLPAPLPPPKPAGGVLPL
jgi:hypothetical protein